MRSILRSGYTMQLTRKVVRVTKKDGTKYRYVRKAGPVRVRPTPIPDVGAVGKGPKLIGKLKGGMLTKYGYHPVEAMSTRHRALARGITAGEEPGKVIKRLTAIGTFTKRTLPRASRIYRADAKWIHEKYLR